jgi:hypothetical protein
MRSTLFSLLALVGLLALVAAGSAVWLVLHQPVVVADAVSTGQYQPLLATLASEFGDLFRALVRYL